MPALCFEDTMKRKILRIDKIIGTLVFAIVVTVLYLLKTPCAFDFIFGVPCPACGMTRACLSLLKFDIIEAFEYHTLFWTLPVIFALFWFDGRVFRKDWLNYLVMITVLALFVIRWIFVII